MTEDMKNCFWCKNSELDDEGLFCSKKKEYVRFNDCCEDWESYIELMNTLGVDISEFFPT